MENIVTKTTFAAMLGVTRGRVSQYIREKKIHGDALVGGGCRARIRADLARMQLGRNLDIDQSLGANGKALAASAGPGADPTIEDQIKLERREQLALSNAKERAAAALRSGRYMLTADARQEMGRVAALLMATFESALSEFANALGTEPPASSRDTLRILKTTWREIRIRQAKAQGAEAALLPDHINDDGGELDDTHS